MAMHPVRGPLAIALLCLSVSACSAGDADSRAGLDVHFKLSDEATASDAGLPAYPGSRSYKDGDDSSSAADIGLSSSLFGFKVVAMNLESTDTPQQVAAFYRRALTKYGSVLDCSEPVAGSRSDREGELTCDPGDADEHSAVYKVGTDQNQRIVAIKPYGDGTRFSLVHVDVRGASKQ